ncbi:putative ankyrin repeat protein [Tolypocladium ophioglossoides CBS 100239]|uniref:Putative ankyrin repeat protein n=1 Tax=Tolypocladium ophioglossoides (strain CBS 100239) TaxID=1163406 RepID=A0A0L0NEF6_TOLOC|nr:putative ankyrin repeat protein [Tolypocladium ophioglossoides CBS 100239]
MPEQALPKEVKAVLLPFRGFVTSSKYESFIQALTSDSSSIAAYSEEDEMYQQPRRPQWLETVASNIDLLYADAKTPLCQAAKEGDEGALQLILESGVDIGTEDNHGRTALSWAAKMGQSAVIELLLASGANTEAKDMGHQTPLIIAAGKGHDTVVELLLASGANIEAKDSSHRTPLLEAMEYDHESTVEVLLGSGTNINAGDYFGDSALVLALGYGYCDMVELLLHNGADLGAHDEHGHYEVLDWVVNDRSPVSDTNIKLLKEAINRRGVSALGPPLPPLPERVGSAYLAEMTHAFLGSYGSVFWPVDDLHNGLRYPADRER